jgi:tetratricopeptide (TPR) repeat protein
VDPTEQLDIPESAQEEYEAGSLAFVSGDTEAALRHLTKALELYPDLQDANYLLALAQLRTGDSESALESLNRVVDNSTNPMLREYARSKISAIEA